MNYIQEIWSLVFQSVSSLPAEFWIYCRWAISLKLILKCDELQSSHQVDIKTRSLQDQPDEESLLFCILLFSLLSSSVICLRNASYLSKRQQHHWFDAQKLKVGRVVPNVVHMIKVDCVVAHEVQVGDFIAYYQHDSRLCKCGDNDSERRRA